MKIIPISELEKLSTQLRKEGKCIVTTNGCFDIVHVGHIRNLQQAKTYGDVLIVGVNSDASVRDNKGPTRPIIPAKERAELIAALDAVDYVFIFNSKLAIPWIKKIKPHIHAKGSDRSLDEMPERETVEALGGKVVLIPHTGKHSTTAIIQKLGT